MEPVSIISIFQNKIRWPECPCFLVHPYLFLSCLDVCHLVIEGRRGGGDGDGGRPVGVHFLPRMHVGRISDIHRKCRRRWDDFRFRAPGFFRPLELVSLQGHLVDRGALVRAAPWPETTGRSTGEAPEIWQQHGDSGVSVHSASLGRINVIKVGGGGGGGSGAGGGGGGSGSKEAYWGGSGLGNKFPPPKEIC